MKIDMKIEMNKLGNLAIAADKFLRFRNNDENDLF